MLALAQHHTVTIPEFVFGDGTVLHDMRLAYTTLGDPSHPAVLLLHGTGGSAQSFFTPSFAPYVFEAHQAFDSSKHFIIIPDALGCGRSSKPSDGLRTAFPSYNYVDMVRAQYWLVTQHLAISHLRAILGYSMGGMHTWLWATQYPQIMDYAIPLACLPTAMSGRNWMLRRLLLQAITQDPTWHNGQYTEQPRGFALAMAQFLTASNGGDIALHALAPNSQAGDRLIKERIQALATLDANDTVYQYAASQDYDVSADLHKVQAQLLLVNSADDERNPVSLGILPSVLKHISSPVDYVLVPATAQGTGHGTVMQAQLWVEALSKLLNHQK